MLNRNNIDQQASYTGEFVTPASQFIDLPNEFTLKRGSVLYDARIAYEIFGKLNSTHTNVILILTGLSTGAHAAENSNDSTPGWWEDMLGPSKPIDTNHWYVICINSLGSCKGSTGPASINPKSNEPYRLDFPELSIEGIADAAAFTVRALGFDQIIGTSMGGMSALALLAQHPRLARNHINISGAAQAQPFAIAIRSLQREMIQFDPCWRQGHYDDLYYPQHGMVMARKLGVITYRSALEWVGRFGRNRLSLDQHPKKQSFDLEFEVESYLEHHAYRFARNFDPNSYLYLSQCMDWFDLSEHSKCSTDKALSQLHLEKALVIGVQADILFPIRQQREIAEGLHAGGVDAQFLALESCEGHDAFLVDIDRFGPAISQFLATLS